MTESTRASLPASDPAPRLTLFPKRMIYLALGIVALTTGQRLGLSWMQSGLLLLPILALEGVFHLLANSRMPRFEGLLMSRISSGAGAPELMALYRQQHLLRFAAPRHQMAAKLALIQSHTGQHGLAAETLRDAIEEAPAKQVLPLWLSLGDALYDDGQWEEAEKIYSEALEEEIQSSRASANLARLILRRQGDPAQARAHFEQALETAHGGGALRCELIELLLDQDQKEDAEWQLQLADEELVSGTEEQRERLAKLKKRLLDEGA